MPLVPTEKVLEEIIQYLPLFKSGLYFYQWRKRHELNFSASSVWRGRRPSTTWRSRESYISILYIVISAVCLLKVWPTWVRPHEGDDLGHFGSDSRPTLLRASSFPPCLSRVAGEKFQTVSAPGEACAWALNPAELMKSVLLRVNALKLALFNIWHAPPLWRPVELDPSSSPPTETHGGKASSDTRIFEPQWCATHIPRVRSSRFELMHRRSLDVCSRLGTRCYYWAAWVSEPIQQFVWSWLAARAM